MANHFHLLLVVQDPDDVVRFVDCVKTELAHAVNRLLGRRNRSVWCDGYDAEPILTLSSALEKFTYLYTNPQSAGLVDTIEQYPGFSTWEMFMKGEKQFSAPWLQRFTIPRLVHKAPTEREDAALAEALRRSSESEHVFIMDHFAWLKCFGIAESRANEFKQQIIENVRKEEERLRRERKGSCIGAERLRRQPLDMAYTPKKFGRRMWCICDDVELRKAFINWVKALRAEAKEVYERWKKGDRSAQYPPGLFPPSFPKLANIVPALAFGG